MASNRGEESHPPNSTIPWWQQIWSELSADLKGDIEVKTQTKILGSIENTEEEIANLEINKNRPINQIKNYRVLRKHTDF